MKIIHVNEKDLKQVTEFLLEKKFIYHPMIAPDGIMDFTYYDNKEYVLILDRNLLTKMIEFFKKGVLKDSYIRKVIGSIMFWSHFNNVSPNSGLALNEYANQKQNNSYASVENNIFLKAMNFYSPTIWLDIALERKDTIEPIDFVPNEKYSFTVVNEHHYMHMPEMFCITRLYFNNSLTPTEKVLRFFEWNLNNLRICQYTLVFSLLVFSGNSKIFKNVDPNDIDKLVKVCSNQAWDITYLSDWSTLYWNDAKDKTVYLFATMDKELKTLFKETHSLDNNLFSKYFNQTDAQMIEEKFEYLRKNRKKPELDRKIIKSCYDTEYDLLKTSSEKHLSN